MQKIVKDCSMCNYNFKYQDEIIEKSKKGRQVG